MLLQQRDNSQVAQKDGTDARWITCLLKHGECLVQLHLGLREIPLQEGDGSQRGEGACIAWPIFSCALHVQARFKGFDCPRILSLLIPGFSQLIPCSALASGILACLIESKRLLRQCNSSLV